MEWQNTKTWICDLKLTGNHIKRFSLKYVLIDYCRIVSEIKNQKPVVEP